MALRFVRATLLNTCPVLTFAHFISLPSLRSLSPSAQFFACRSSFSTRSSLILTRAETILAYEDGEDESKPDTPQVAEEGAGAAIAAVAAVALGVACHPVSRRQIQNDDGCY